jgi:hypothetical protein
VTSGAAAIHEDWPCPICGQGALEPFLRIDGLPVMTTQLWDDQDAASAAPRGDMMLGICRSCAAIRNLAFDPDKVAYTGEYENSQMFSGAFRTYAEALADRLVAEFGLDDGTVFELGAGKGEFLQMLCAAGCARAVGFDPSYGGEVDGGLGADCITIHRRLFGPDDHVVADLVVSRHVLEHLVDPVDVLRTVRAGLGERTGSLYVEVPDARYVLTDEGMWDFIYPHVTYFGPAALTAAVTRAGFAVSAVEAVFGGQFLTVVATTADASDATGDEDSVGAMVRQAKEFAERYQARIDHWRQHLAEDGRTALWGAGAKGVTFLNAVSGSDVDVDVVVDVNPRKRGSFLPGTGHEVVAPDQLRSLKPDRVILMNPMYRDEVHEALKDLDVHAEVLVV